MTISNIYVLRALRKRLPRDISFTHTKKVSSIDISLNDS